MCDNAETGDINEITANNFIKDLNRDLTKTELKEIKSILKQAREEKIDIDPKQIQGKYQIFLYDSSESEILEFIFDKDFNIYCSNGKRIRCEKLVKWMENKACS